MPAIIRFSLPGLKKITKENNIEGTSTMNKPEILKLLRERDHVPAEELNPAEKPSKVIDKKTSSLNLCKNAKKVYGRYGILHWDLFPFNLQSKPISWMFNKGRHH